MATLEADILPRDETLAQELAREDHVEMANVFEDESGIPGVIFISTTMASHGPRVKYFLRAGRDQPSFSVALSDPPRVVANSLPTRDFARRAPDVLRWAALNREALLRFWNEGETLSAREVVRFIDGLQKLAP